MSFIVDKPSVSTDRVYLVKCLQSAWPGLPTREFRTRNLIGYPGTSVVMAERLVSSGVASKPHVVICCNKDHLQHFSGTTLTVHMLRRL